jgi:hypothetical protein
MSDPKKLPSSNGHHLPVESFKNKDVEPHVETIHQSHHPHDDDIIDAEFEEIHDASQEDDNVTETPKATPQKSYKGLAVAGFAAVGGLTIGLGIAASILFEYWDFAKSGSAINKGYIHDAYSQSTSTNMNGGETYVGNHGLDNAADGMTHYVTSDRVDAFESSNTTPEPAFTFRENDCVAVSSGPTNGFNEVSFTDLNGDTRTVYIPEASVTAVPAGQRCNIK